MPPRPVPINIQSSPSTVAGTTVTTNTTATSVTKGSKSKSQVSQANTELEFTQRFLSLFTTFYETPSIDEIITFPEAKPIPQSEVKSPTRAPPFHSGVWDLRLKKAIEARLTNDQLTSDSLSEQVLQLRESLASESPDLNDVFVPSKAERPPIPLYIANIEKDEKELKAEASHRNPPMSSNVAEYTRLFSERLKRQKQMSKERQKRRFMRAKQLENEHNDFVKTLHHSKIPEDDIRTTTRAKFKVLQEQRSKQLQEGKKAVEEMRSKSPVKPRQQEPIFSLQ